MPQDWAVDIVDIGDSSTRLRAGFVYIDAVETAVFMNRFIAQYGLLKTALEVERYEKSTLRLLRSSLRTILSKPYCFIAFIGHMRYTETL